MRPLLRQAAWIYVAALGLAAVTGCTAWKKQGTSADALLRRENPPKEFRVTMADGYRLLLRAPGIRGDSLVGRPGHISKATKVRESGWGDWTEERTTKTWADVDTALALADIRMIEIRQVDAGKTVLLAVGVGATVLLVAAIIASSSDDGSPGPTTYSNGSSGDGCLFCSCPLIHSWNGGQWVLDSGTYGGAFLQPLAYTDYDMLEALTEEGGFVRLRLDAGDQETDHVDELAILAVDHDPSVKIATSPDGAVHTIGAPVPPISARDGRGRDGLPLVTTPDGRPWESALVERDTASVEDRRDGLVVEFPRPDRPETARLVVKARKTVWATHLMRSFVRAQGTGITKWYEAMEADSAASAAFRGRLRDEVELEVSLWRDGRWMRQASVWGGGPEIDKTHAVPLDLTGLEGDTVRVRLESVPSFWLVDWVALDSSPEQSVRITELPLEQAVAYDGRDVRAQLNARDGEDLVLHTGDGVDVRLSVPDVPPGMARTYLSRTHGWYRFHAPETSPVDSTLIAAVLYRPGGISKEAVSQSNRAVRAARHGL